jgi:methylthioribose-1-phosphate isomerase
MRDLHSLGLKRLKGELQILDQTKLPSHEDWVTIRDAETMVKVIQRLAVRGAPLIGVAAALALSLEKGKENLRKKALALREARPTAVNLMHAMDRMLRVLETKGEEAIPQEAEEIFFEDVELCLQMAKRAANVIQDGENIITHCNTGGLATAGVGTALGAVRIAAESGKRIHVFVDETRPLLQGSRLTTWELDRLKIPFTLICDNMAAFLLSKNQVQRAFVGADRIAQNRDVANKVGTYSLAVNCKFHQVPFYVVAPSTTFDPSCKSGKDIPIEERGSEEVIGERGFKNSKVWNPAFDVTPGTLIQSIFLEDREL